MSLARTVLSEHRRALHALRAFGELRGSVDVGAHARFRACPGPRDRRRLLRCRLGSGGGGSGGGRGGRRSGRLVAFGRGSDGGSAGGSRRGSRSGSGRTPTLLALLLSFGPRSAATSAPSDAATVASPRAATVARLLSFGCLSGGSCTPAPPRLLSLLSTLEEVPAGHARDDEDHDGDDDPGARRAARRRLRPDDDRLEAVDDLLRRLLLRASEQRAEALGHDALGLLRDRRLVALLAGSGRCQRRRRHRGRSRRSRGSSGARSGCSGSGRRSSPWLRGGRLRWLGRALRLHRA
jgi:hypothetical protein